MNDVVSVDIDECASNTHKCDLHSSCVNTIGSYKCSCFDGFSGTGLKCTGYLLSKKFLPDCLKCFKLIYSVYLRVNYFDVSEMF